MLNKNQQPPHVPTEETTKCVLGASLVIHAKDRSENCTVVWRRSRKVTTLLPTLLVDRSLLTGNRPNIMKQCILKPSLACVGLALCFLTSQGAIALAQENEPTEEKEPEMSPAETEQAKEFLRRNDVQRILRLAHQTDTSRSFKVEDLPIINQVITESTGLFKRGQQPFGFL